LNKELISFVFASTKHQSVVVSTPALCSEYPAFEIHLTQVFAAFLSSSSSLLRIVP